MLFNCLLISILLCVIYALAKRKNRIRLLVKAENFAYLFISMGWMRGVYDVEIGILRYNNFMNYQHFTEVGYSFLIQRAHDLGMDYRMFFIISAIVEVGALFWFVRRNAKHEPIVLALFLIWPMVAFVQYTRSLLAFSIVLYGLDSLLNKRPKYVFKYLISIFLASTIHFSSLFFLIFLVVSYLDEKKVFIINIAAFGFLYIVTNVSVIYNLVSKYVGKTRAEILARSVDVDGNFGRVVCIVIYMLQFFAIYWILKKVFKVSMDEERSHLYYKINMCSIILISSVLNVGTGFARFPILLSIVNYCFLSDKISEIPSQRKRILMYMILLFFAFVWMYINVRNVEYRELVVYPFFQQNELLRVFD